MSSPTALPKALSITDSQSSTATPQAPNSDGQSSPTARQSDGCSASLADLPCFSLGPVRLEQLPPEVLILIVELTVPVEDKRLGTVTKHFPIHESRTQTIQSLARVSRRINAIAKKVMYRSITLTDSETSILLLHSLLLFPHNRELVRHLEVRPPTRVIRPVGTEFSRFFDFHKVLQMIYNSEVQHPQLPSGFVIDLKHDFERLTGQAEWKIGRYPQGGFNMVTRTIIYLCNNLESFRVKTMGEWSGSTCRWTRTQPSRPVTLCAQPSMIFSHLHILDLDVSVSYFPLPPLICSCQLIWPPNVSELILRHEDASLSRNFVEIDGHHPYGLPKCHAIDLHELSKFLEPCYPSLRKLRLLGGFDHAGLLDPSNLFSKQTQSVVNWNTILRLFQQLTHLEFSGYGDPCPPDDRHRNTWPDNVYRYGTGKTFSCLARLPKLRYLKLPLLDLFPLPPSPFPDTHAVLKEWAREEIPVELHPGDIAEDPLAVYHCRRLKRLLVGVVGLLAESVDTGEGIHHNIEQKLRQAAGGREIPRDLERVDLYYFVEDTDKTKDPRERWAKSGQYASLTREEIEAHEEVMWRQGGWFPTKEVIITWRRSY